jgi:hypothetical protein
MNILYHSWAYIWRNINQHTREIDRFIIVQFTVAKLWNEPRYTTTNELIESAVYIDNGVLFNNEEWNNTICSKMHRAGDHHVEWA